MEKPKVCILTSVHSPFDTRIFHKQAKSLAEAGYDITLIAQHSKKEIIDDIKIVPLEKNKNRFERIFKSNWQVFKKALKEDADIYHFHDPELIPIGLLLKLKGKKVIYDVHEDVPQQILSKEWIWKPIRKLVSNLVNSVEKLADKFLTAIVSATPAIDNKFNNKNSIAVQNFPLLNELNRLEVSEDKSEKNIITYVGGISEIRGIKEMIQAVEYLPEKYKTKFLLAGNFSSNSLKKKAKKLNGWDRVEFQGWIDREQVAENLAKAKVGLVCFHPAPNHMNAQPNKMFEYMSAALPVIASNFPLWEEIIEGNNCGINVEPQNPKEIAEAIQYIFEHPKEAKQMGRNSRKAVEEKYNWSIEEKKLLDLYQKIMEV